MTLEYKLAISKKLDITAVVLAGGKETRLLSLRLALPKAFALLNKKPLIEHQVDFLKSYVSGIVVAAGTYPHKFENAFSNIFNMNISSDPAIGTGIAILEASRLIKKDHIILLNADTINNISIKAVLRKYKKHAEYNNAMIVLTRRKNVQNEGAFAVLRNGRVIRSFEDRKGGRPPHPLADWHGASTGIILMPRKLLRQSTSEHLSISLELDILPRLIKMKKLYAYDNKDRFSLDIGTPERFNKFSDLQQGLINFFRES